MPSATSPALVLLVEDHPNSRLLAERVLRSEGYDVLVAENGAMALDLLNRHVPDLVLLDIMMPGMDGYEVCHFLRSGPFDPELPIIFLTAKDRTEDLLEGFKAGGTDFLSKPFEVRELRTRLASHLDRYRQHRRVVELQQRQERVWRQLVAGLQEQLADQDAQHQRLVHHHRAAAMDAAALSLALEAQRQTYREFAHRLEAWVALEFAANAPTSEWVPLRPLFDRIESDFESRLRSKALQWRVPGTRVPDPEPLPPSELRHAAAEPKPGSDLSQRSAALETPLSVATTLPEESLWVPAAAFRRFLTEVTALAVQSAAWASALSWNWEPSSDRSAENGVSTLPVLTLVVTVEVGKAQLLTALDTLLPPEDFANQVAEPRPLLANLLAALADACGIDLLVELSAIPTVTLHWLPRVGSSAPER